MPPLSSLGSSARHSFTEVYMIVSIYTPWTELTNRYIFQASRYTAPATSFGVSPGDTSTAPNLVMSVDTPNETYGSRVDLLKTTWNAMPRSTNFATCRSPSVPYLVVLVDSPNSTLTGGDMNQSATDVSPASPVASQFPDFSMAVHSPDSARVSSVNLPECSRNASPTVFTGLWFWSNGTNSVALQQMTTILPSILPNTPILAHAEDSCTPWCYVI